MADRIESTSTANSLATLAKANSTRRARPPSMEALNSMSGPREPLSGKIERQDSKMGLRNLFGRSKTENRSTKDFTAIAPSISEGLARSHYDPQTPATKKSRASVALDKRPLSVMSTRPSTSASLPRRSTMTSPNMKGPAHPVRASTVTERPSRSLTATWEPPPLFQAFPQAIKHALIPALNMSADTIIRLSNHKRNTSLRDEMAQTQEGEGDSDSARKKAERIRKHRRQLSASISKGEWSQKMYVLVTSGYLLQYAGEGVYDRLPEKIMQLGKDSVAFASDVIPGKHWVLQISQAMNADGTPVPDSRSLFSKLSLRGESRRHATSLLLVFEQAEEMDAWLTAIRREIEALGGKKHVTETGQPKEEKQATLKHQTSSRYLVTRNLDRFSMASPSPGDDSPVIPTQRSHEEIAFKRFSIADRKPSSSETQSITTVGTSNDGHQLDGLRDSRYSYVSSGQGTIVTSSPESSPIKETFEEISSIPESGEATHRSNSKLPKDRRRSMQPLRHSSGFDTRQAHKAPRPHSTLASLPNNATSSMASLPNFSMPSQTQGRLSAILPAVDMPHTMENKRSQEPLRPVSSGKNVPTLNIVVPPRPKLVNSHSQPPVYTPTLTSFKKLQVRKPELIDIPARTPKSPLSPAASSPASSIDGRSHRASMMSLHPPNKNHMRTQKRHSSALELPSPPSTTPSPTLPSPSSASSHRVSSFPSQNILPTTPFMPSLPLRQFEPMPKLPSQPHTLERPKTADRVLLPKGSRENLDTRRPSSSHRARPTSMQPQISMKPPPMPSINFSRPVTPAPILIPPPRSSKVSRTPSGESRSSSSSEDTKICPLSAVGPRPASAFSLRVRSPDPMPVPDMPTRSPLRTQAKSPRSPQPPSEVRRTASPTLQRLRAENPKLGARRSMSLRANAKRQSTVPPAQAQPKPQVQSEMKPQSQAPPKPQAQAQPQTQAHAQAHITVAGPPPAPPPNCALPPLPPAAVAAARAAKRKSHSHIESIERSRNSIAREARSRRSLAVGL